MQITGNSNGSAFCRASVKAAEDIAAYGGWTMDDHNPAGFRHTGEPTIYHPAPSPFGIPYRSMYSANIKNLFFAGRNISATHAALSATRVMATCALIGQAVGNAAALCNKYACKPNDVYEAHLKELQAEILYDGCWLPGLTRTVDSYMQNAKTDLSDEERRILFNGEERPDENDSVNYISRGNGESISFTFERPASGVVRLILDPDYSRESVSDNLELRRYSMRSNMPLAFKPLKMPANLAKKLKVTAFMADGTQKVLYESAENDRHLLFLPTGGTIKGVIAEFFGAWQSDVTNIYSFELVEK